MRRLLFCAAMALPLAGCNVIADIHEAASVETDAGNGTSSGTSSGAASGGATSGSDPSSGQSSGLEPVPPPTDAGTTLHPWAAWTMPNPPSSGLPSPQSYDAGAPGVVEDEVTGLAWQATASPNAYSWDAARSYCNSLDLAGGGWRLPSRIELISLIDFTQAPATISPQAFPNTAQDYFWSGSLAAHDASYAWAVTFNFSVSPVINDTISQQYRVRCVRP